MAAGHAGFLRSCRNPAGPALQEQGDGAPHQGQGHHRVGDPGAAGEQQPEQGAEGGPQQGEGEADEGQQHGKARQRQRLPLVIGEDVGLMDTMP